MSNGCPCKDCEKKGCGGFHDICGPYQEWRNKVDEQNASMRMEKESHNTMSDANKRAMWRNKRYSRRIPNRQRIETK